MPGKGDRDYQILILTDDPHVFDKLPPAEGGWEARMHNRTTRDHFTKEDEGFSRGSLSAPADLRVVEEPRPLSQEDMKPGEPCNGVVGSLEGEYDSEDVSWEQCPGRVVDGHCTREEDHA